MYNGERRKNVSIEDLRLDTTMIAENLKYLHHDFGDMKNELKNISKILEVQVRHSERLSHAEDTIKELHESNKNLVVIGANLESLNSEFKGFKGLLVKIGSGVFIAFVGAAISYAFKIF